ncbi:hypothetical protein QTP88_007455 [Uroleucon formosanum]
MELLSCNSYKLKVNNISSQEDTIITILVVENFTICMGSVIQYLGIILAHQLDGHLLYTNYTFKKY